MQDDNISNKINLIINEKALSENMNNIHNANKEEFIKQNEALRAELDTLRAEMENLRSGSNLNNQIIKEGKYSHHVQMLILDYLGIGKGKRNIDRAKIYAPLIRRDVKTTTQYFTDLYGSDSKNEKNLNLILDFFERAGNSDIAERVKYDIISLKKRKN